MNGMDLDRTALYVSTRLSELDAALHELDLAHRAVSEAQSEMQRSSGSAYAEYSTPDGSYKPDKASASYATHSPGGLETRVNQAMQKEAETAARVRDIVDGLKQHGGRIQDIRNGVMTTVRGLGQFGGMLHDENARSEYRKGESRQRERILRCNELLTKIDGALRRAGAALGRGSAGGTGNRTSKLDTILEGGRWPARGRAQDNYVDSTVQSLTIYRLDTGRYGQIDEMPKYPLPNLKRPGPIRSGGLADKLILGHAYSRFPAAVQYVVPLPNWYDRLRRRGYARKEDPGSYTMMDEYS